MAMRNGIATAGAALLLLALAGCNGPPWTLSRSPAEIALRWYPDEIGPAPAAQLAGLHCLAWGRAAVLAADNRDGSAEIATYRCR
ncbi:MAG TPA: hypothetical protein VGF07_03250 [Stellaceae bacterium]|jgi:hypothetical protein